jgi:hypothetical protein
MPAAGRAQGRWLPGLSDWCHTGSSGAAWGQTPRDTCNATGNATGFERCPTEGAPSMCSHQATEENSTPGSLKALSVSLVKPVAYPLLISY